MQGVHREIFEKISKYEIIQRLRGRKDCARDQVVLSPQISGR
jgi:hypothetical protein